MYFATLTGLEPATSAVTGRRANQLRYRAKRKFRNFLIAILLTCTPNGIRTRAAAVKGRCPRPLDDGGLLARISTTVDARETSIKVTRWRIKRAGTFSRAEFGNARYHDDLIPTLRTFRRSSRHTVF